MAVGRPHLEAHLAGKHVAGDLVLRAHLVRGALANLYPVVAHQRGDLVAQREVRGDLLQRDARALHGVGAAQVDFERGFLLAGCGPAGVGVAIGEVFNCLPGIDIRHDLAARDILQLFGLGIAHDLVHGGHGIVLHDLLGKRLGILGCGLGGEAVVVLVALAVGPFPAKGEPVEVLRATAVLESLLAGVRPGLPARFVIAAGEAGPLAIRVVDQRAVLLQAPGSDERARVELEEVGRPVVGVLEQRARVLDPRAQHEVAGGGEHAVLGVEHLEHLVRQQLEALGIALLVGVAGERLVLLERVGQHLAHHVDEVVAERLGILIRVVALDEELRGALELLLVVVDVAVAPGGGGADLVVRRARVHDGLAGALVVLAVHVLVRGVEQDVPGFLDLGVGAPVAALDIAARPRAVVHGVLLPGHVEQQLVDDGGVVDGLGRDADAAHVPVGVVRLWDLGREHLGHAVHAHAAAEVVQHVPHPRYLLVLHGARLRAQVALQVEDE